MAGVTVGHWPGWDSFCEGLWGHGIRKASVFFPTFSKCVMLGRQLLFLSQNENALNLQSMMLQARRVEGQGWASECGSDEQTVHLLFISFYCAWGEPVGFLAVACVYSFPVVVSQFPIWIGRLITKMRIRISYSREWERVDFRSPSSYSSIPAA